MVGKPRSYETDDSETNVAVRPESITQVDEPPRDRWVVETADQTIDRLEAFDAETNDYAQMAREEYGERLSPYREAAIAALESLDATDNSASTATSGAESDASGSEPLASDTDPVEEDESTPPESEESVGTDESARSGESSSNDGSDIEEPSEDTALGEYD